jgi:Mg-chelatase subunit ChlD
VVRLALKQYFRSTREVVRHGLYGTLAAVMLVSLVAGFLPEALRAAGCPEYEFIGARGSGESAQPNTSYPAYAADNHYGMGTVIFDTYSRLIGLVGADRVAAYGVHYPAVGLTDSISDYMNAAGAFLHIEPLGSYTDSVRQGTQDVQNHIESMHASCASTRFILAGYSQGAQAVGDALQTMPAADRQLVAGATFFGDPLFNAESWSSKASDSEHFGVLGVRSEWDASLFGHVFSYCQPHDPICGISKKASIPLVGDIYYRDFPWFRGFGPHGDYIPKGDTTDAARQLARLLGAATPSAGTVPLDLVFAIDTTGSMGGIIGQVKNNVTSLAQSIAAASSNYRFALVDYKDGPEQGDPYRAQVDLGFTTDVQAFSNATATLSAYGGGDYPESVYSGVMMALNLPWRDGVKKAVIVIGDAPGKDPEPVTGYTLATVQAKALAVDPAQVYTVAASLSSDVTGFMAALANATGGTTAQTNGSTDVVSALQSSIVAVGSAPVADAGGPYTGIVNDPVTFSAGGSRDDSENITHYDWDFNGDGVYDVTTDSPITSHAFVVAGTYQVTLRTRSASGLAGIATSTVTVTNAPALPGPVQALTATPGDGTVTLQWTEGSGGTPAWYTITDGAGTVLDRVSAEPDGSAPTGWVDQNLANGTSYVYKVSAGNVSGESALAGPVTTKPHTPDQAPVAVADTYATDSVTPLNIPAPGVLANDTDPDAGDTLAATLASTTTHGTLVFQPDGSFSYVAGAGYVGTDSFSYKAVDSQGVASAIAMVTIDVSAPVQQAHQHLVLVIPGRPPLTLSGNLASGRYDILAAAGRIDAVTGAGMIIDTRDGSITVTFDLHRHGSLLVGTVTAATVSGQKWFAAGQGTVRQNGRITTGVFKDGPATFSFVITTTP